MRSILEVQKRLKELTLYSGALDNKNGPLTKAAVRAFQRINGLRVDGIAGKNTQAKLWPEPIPERDFVPPTDAPALARLWPRQKDVPSFFGPPGSAAATAGTCVLPFPFLIAWNLNQRITKFSCHVKVVEPMTRIFRESAAHYGEDEFRRLHLDRFGGCYANRPMRGGTRPSMHAYGIAYDADPEHNQLLWTDGPRDRRGNPAPIAELSKPVYEPFWRIVEATGAVSLGRVANYDWMHFQFARL